MPETHTDVACTVCACVCDDLQVTVSDARVEHVERACRLAEPWFDSLKKVPTRPPATIEGRPVPLALAIERAAEILRASRAPIIGGLSRSSTAGQRAAVLLAEKIGANLDPISSVARASSIIAMQSAGESTCSLGEVRNRADLVIFWGADPVRSHPRHFERYSADVAGLFVPRGRADRHLVVIDSEDTATSRLADTFIKIPRHTDFEVIWALRQLVRGVELPPSCDIGVAHELLNQLAARMKVCQYGALFFGPGLTRQSPGHAAAEALLRLVADLNAFTRFAARGMSEAGGSSGAEAALAWLTGFPFAVNLARGYSRYSPGEYTANELLERGEVDACLFVGSESCSLFSPRAQQAIERLPTITLDYPHAERLRQATVQITTAIYGIHAPGTAYRMDGVPIPLRQLVPSGFPTDDDVLQAIARQLG